MFDPLSMIAALYRLASERAAQILTIAALISFLAAYTALALAGRSRGPTRAFKDPWLGAAAVALGCGVWASQLLALVAWDPAVRAAYALAPALFAIAIGVVFTWLGFALATRRRTILGGMTIGSAAAVMNCAVMSAALSMQLTDAAALSSFLVGASSGAVSLHVSRRWPRATGQLTAALILTLGVLGIHFAGILALVQAPVTALALEPIPGIWLPVGVTAISVLIVGLGVIGSLADQHVMALETTRTELERTADQLRHAAKAATTADEAKSQFLAGMSHELRTPLNAILGFSELMKEERGNTLNLERVRSYSASIFESGTHLLALINDILDLSKFDAGRLELNDEPVDLRRAVESCLRLMEPHARKAEVAIDTALPDSLPDLWADDRRLRQILFNLLSNAVKFTAPGGSVHVGVHWDDDGIAIAVSDTGIGMRPEQIPIALERFGQIDGSHARKYAGTGLALPLTKHLVELHGGTLGIASQPGVGTTVTVLFPPERLLRVREAA